MYTIDGSGAVTVKMTLDATGTGMGQLLKVGSTMTLPAGYEDITWYGNGPSEGYIDRCTYAMTGVYTLNGNRFLLSVPEDTDHWRLQWREVDGSHR